MPTQNRSSLNHWPRRWPTGSMLSLTCIIGLAACGSEGWNIDLAGSESPPTQPAASTPDNPPALAADTENAGGDSPDPIFPRSAAILLRVNFDIYRARVPEGVFSGSGKVWNHLDVDALPAETARLLLRSGLRIGRGKIDAWPPIKAILENESTVENSRFNMTVGNGLPLSFEFDDRPRDQILFLYRPDGTSAGFRYRASINLLRIEYRIPETAPDSVELVVMPEIRMLNPRRNPELTPNGWGPDPAPFLRRLLSELAFTITLGPDEFLAVGPGPETRRSDHLIGALMLREKINGKLFESMYFLTPQVVRSDRSASE